MSVRKLWSRQNEILLVWPGEEPLLVRYNNHEFLVPPRFEVAKPGLGSPYRLPSATNARGELVRGTIVVKDVSVETDTGGWETILDVQQMARYLVRDREDLFARGFQVVSTVDEVSVALAIGIPQYEKSQDERARQIIANEMDRRRRFEEKGQPAPPSSSEHLIAWAIKHLKSRTVERPQFSTEDLRATLEGRYAAGPSRAPEPAEEPGLGQRLYVQARDAGVQLTKGELAGILDSDPEQMEFVRQKIAARMSAQLEKRLDAEEAARQEGVSAE